MAYFRFLDLPHEIRNLVYAEVGKDMYMQFDRHMIVRPSWTFSISEVDYSGPGRRRRSALLSTSQQLRTEMLDHMAVSMPLNVGDVSAQAHPASAMETSITSVVRQQLQAIVIHLPNHKGPFASRLSLALTEWLSDTFARLQQVTYRDIHFMQSPVPLLAVEEDATSHAVVIRSQLAKQYSAIKAVYDQYHDKGLALNFYLVWYLQGFRPGPVPAVPVWVCQQSMLSEHTLMWAVMRVLQGT